MGPTSVFHFFLTALTTSCSSSSSFCESSGLVCTGIRTRSFTTGIHRYRMQKLKHVWTRSDKKTERLQRRTAHTCSWTAEVQDEGLSGKGVHISSLIIFILVRGFECHLILSEIQNKALRFVCILAYWGCPEYHVLSSGASPNVTFTSVNEWDVRCPSWIVQSKRINICSTRTYWQNLFFTVPLLIDILHS